MKFNLKHIIFSFTLVVCSWILSSQNSNIKGYTVNGDILTFIFEVDDYPNIKFNGEEIKDVFVSGEFNDWATEDWQWHMRKISDSRYELDKKLYDFTSDFDWEFKFVVNGKHWAEPSQEFDNITEAKTPKGKPLMVYNLKLYSAFATKYGNVTFNLKGYQYAKNVIVSGTFNRWNTNGFKLKKSNNGWSVTLQLRPDIYEYKFIVDGNWIIDPQNPSRAKNKFGGYNSVIDVQKNMEFRLCGYQNAKSVILSGDFNNWSESDYKLKLVDGCWVYNKSLSGGKYHYKYIVDGQWILDPKNSIKEFDSKGHINSVCMVK